MEVMISMVLLFIEYYAFYLLSSGWLAKNKIPTILYFVSAVCLNYALNFMGINLLMIRYILSYLINLILVCVFFDGDYLKKIMIPAVYFIVVFGLDYLLTLIVMFIFHIGLNDVMQSPPLFILNALISKVLLYFVSYVIHQKIKENQKKLHITRLQWLQVSLYILTCILSLFLIFQQFIFTNQSSPLLIVVTLLMIVAAIAQLSLITKLAESNEVQYREGLLLQKMQIETTKYIQLTQVYEKQRKLTHEFKNHMQSILTLVKNREDDKVIDYIEGITEKIFSLTYVIHTNHPLVDALINEKYYEAKKYDIDIKMMIDDLSDLPLKEDEFIVILSNLLDNAIEACMKCTDDKRIKVKLKFEDDLFIISVHNTFDGIIKIKDQNFITSKTNSLEHGYGIKNIKDIASKNHYIYSIENDYEWFKFNIIINID